MNLQPFLVLVNAFEDTAARPTCCWWIAILALDPEKLPNAVRFETDAHRPPSPLGAVAVITPKPGISADR